MDDQIIKILKDKDDYKNVVEIKDNAKGEAQISVKARGEDMTETMNRAIKNYKKIQKELANNGHE